MANKTLSVVEKGSVEPRIYYVVSNKVSSSAPKRNQLKRRLRAATREIFKKSSPNKTIVIYARRDSLRKTYQELLLELKIALNKL